MSNKAEIIEFLAREFPQNTCTVEEVGKASAVVKQRIGADELRPGGTVSGPVLMGVADLALYVALLGEIGIVPLAVITNLTINFLRKPSAHRSIIGASRLIKVGKVLAVGEVDIFSEGAGDIVAHALGMYSIPQRRQG